LSGSLEPPGVCERPWLPISIRLICFCSVSSDGENGFVFGPIPFRAHLVGAHSTAGPVWRRSDRGAIRPGQFDIVNAVSMLPRSSDAPTSGRGVQAFEAREVFGEADRAD